MDEEEQKRFNRLVEILPTASPLTRKLSKFMAENNANVAEIVVSLGLFIKEIAEEINTDVVNVLESIEFTILHTTMEELH